MKLEDAHYVISKLSIKLMYLRQCGVDIRADKSSNEREQRQKEGCTFGQLAKGPCQLDAKEALFNKHGKDWVSVWIKMHLAPFLPPRTKST